MPPVPTREGTVLPTHVHLTPPGYTAHRAPQVKSSPVCTKPACSNNQQAGGKQEVVGHPFSPRGIAHKGRYLNIAFLYAKSSRQVNH